MARLPIPPREIHPKAHNCPIHLRRICGVCARFEGATMRSRGNCTYLREPVMGLSSAAECEKWTRKTKGVDE